MLKLNARCIYDKKFAKQIFAQFTKYKGVLKVNAPPLEV